MVYQFHPIPHSSPFTKKTPKSLGKPCFTAFFVAFFVAGCAELYDVEEEESRPTSRQWISRVSPQRIWGKAWCNQLFRGLFQFISLKKIPNIENPTKIENQGFFSCSKDFPSLHIYILIHFYNQPIISEATPPTVNFQDEVLHWEKYIFPSMFTFIF